MPEKRRRPTGGNLRAARVSDTTTSTAQSIPVSRFCGVYGVAEVDLRDASPESAARRCAMLIQIPDGARLVLHVGPLAVEPSVV